MSDAPEETVDSLLDQRVDGEIQSTVWYRSRDSAHYGLVTSLRDNDTAALTTVLLDTEDDTLRVLDNSMWLPAEGEVLDAAVRSVARLTNGATDSLDSDADPMRDSLVGFDSDEIGQYTLRDDYTPSDDSSGDWKESGGREERWTVHERLQESGISNADRLIRLEFEGKAPWEGEPQRVMYPPSEIGANYGVECDEDGEIVIIDIDDMEEAPREDLPETLTVESPHGGEHRYYHVPDAVETFRERFSVENPHTSFGETRAGDGYVVGPGSILTDCKHGCCTEEDPGRYQLVDREIQTVDADRLSDILAPFREGDA